ncbi:HAD family hydrolase [Alteribacter keqinensis]|uniref:HAD family hydrolase n=1 Tax=Alteribacter keqinensis TaxID=2483800 RepID=A0A3M7TYG4_9BACI|nr:HAD family hydrolase [Alteribacter keqinensis]RNA69942.1 HAD family hydrolase [Alteribacter keqinensis]
MIKAVLFDLDGTLLDRDTSVRHFIQNQYDRMGMLLGNVSKARYTERFIELDERGYVWKDQVYKELTAEFSITDITWSELLNDYLVSFQGHCVGFPHMAETLKQLKRDRYKLGIVSNGRVPFQLNNIRALGIEPYFDTIVISEREEIKKPDADIFHRALDRLGVKADHAVFIGDHPVNDVKAARAAGMKAVWKETAALECTDADRVMRDFRTLPGLITSLEQKL